MQREFRYKDVFWRFCQIFVSACCTLGFVEDYSHLRSRHGWMFVEVLLNVFHHIARAALFLHHNPPTKPLPRTYVMRTFLSSSSHIYLFVNTFTSRWLDLRIEHMLISLNTILTHCLTDWSIEDTLIYVFGCCVAVSIWLIWKHVRCK